MMLLGALAAYVSIWWMVAQPDHETRLLATIVLLGALAVAAVVYWVAMQGQERADKRYYEIKALAEKVADAVTQSTGDGRLITSADPDHATLAKELAEMRSAITRIER